MRLLLIGIMLTEIVKYGIWLKGINNRKLQYYPAGILIALGFMLWILTGAADVRTPLLLFSCITVIIYGCMLKKGGYEKAAELLKAFFIITCAGEAVGNTIQLALGLEIRTLQETKINYLAGNLLLIFIFYILYILKRRIKIKGNRREKKIYDYIIYAFILLMGVSFCMTISGINYISRYIPEKSIRNFINIIGIISFFSIICLSIILLYITKENKIIKEYLENDKLLISTQKSLYEAMLTKNRATKDFRHDVENHLICLNELVYRGDISKVKNYLEDIEGQVRIIGSRVYTVGNDVVDAVLNHYLSMLHKGVQVSVEGECREELGIGPVELCTVASNLFKNAVEALEELEDEEGFLKVRVASQKDSFIIQVRNSRRRQEILWDKKRELPVTTKEDKENHGIGLRNVKETVEKWGGIFNIEIEEREFAVSVLLPYIINNDR